MELKEIQNYLAYGVRFKGKRKDWASESDIMILCPVDLDDRWSNIKLILHPLSDLTKPYLEGGKIPIVELAKMTNININWRTIVNHDGNSSFSVHSVDMKNEFWYGWNSFSEISNSRRIVGLNQLQLFDWLFEHHFDVYGLIEKGEAVDTNTLK